jgi:ssDNA-binding Zn-finger/Zn-ribbon topoisomerase 1
MGTIFNKTGGIRDRLPQARVATRDTGMPACPACGKPMCHRHSKKGDFWGCAGYPDCRGTLDIPQPS